MAKERSYYIGFDLGGTKMLACVVDKDFNIVAKYKKKTKAEKGQEEGLKRTQKCIDSALEEADVKPEELLGIGFGLPGVLDLKKGRIVRLMNVGWTDVPMCEHFGKIYDCPVAIDNDVNTGTFGEFRLGAGKGQSDVVGIFPGTGIGGGIVIDGKLLHGITGGAAEIGHLVFDPNGAPCGCGNRGCYETVASRVAVASQAAGAVFRGKAPALQDIAGADVTNIKSGALAESIEKGDKAIEEIVRSAAYKVGLLACDMINTFSPGMIILGGGLVEAMEKIFVEECKRAVSKHAIAELREPVKIKAAKLGDYAVALGGACLAADLVGKNNGKMLSAI